MEDAEDQPEGVDRGQEGGDVADDRERDEPVAAVDRVGEDLVLGEDLPD